MMDILETASILDEHIEKAAKKAFLEKGVTFDPSNPHLMGGDSSYYSPYLELADGGFVPFPVQHWKDQGRDENAYNTTRQFYQDAGERFKPVEEAVRAFRGFGKSIDTLFKALPVPIGTIHTYADGVKYKKMKEGQWLPVRSPNTPAFDHPSEGKRKKASLEIDTHAQKVKAIQDEQKKRKETHALVHTTKKEVLRHVRTALGKTIPPEAKQHFDLRRRTPGSQAKTAATKTKAGEDDGKAATVLAGLQEKVKRLGKGEGREVKLAEAEVKTLLESGKYALISAGKNPANREDRKMSQADIKARYALLRRDLVSDGFAFSKVKGHYQGTEDSFLVMVHDADKEHIKSLGKKYKQDSVIYSEGGKHELHYTTGNDKLVGEDGETMKSTSEQYMEGEPPPPHYVPERKELHNKIIKNFLSKTQKATGKPVAVITGGGSGSGKSTVIKHMMGQGGLGKDLVHVDADEIKKHIPEYQEGVAKKDEKTAAFVHDESSHVTSEMINQSVKDGKNFLYDSTFSNTAKFEKLIGHLKSNGYHVHIVYADLPPEEAEKRATQRAAKSGRKVPTDTIRSTHKNALNSLNKLHHLADSVSVYSTMGEPKRVYHREPGAKEVDDQGMQEMRKRGHLIKSEAGDGEDEGTPMGGEKDLLDKIDTAFRSGKSGDEEISDVVDEGVSYDEYPGGEKS